MTAPENGACGPWIGWDALPCTIDLAIFGDDDAQDAMKAMILQAVSNTLWERSCRQFGPCEITARPVPCCAHYRVRCSCGSYPLIDLGRNPVAEVTEVAIDGTVLAEGDYRVDDWRWLVRLGSESWPTCNDLSVADDEQGAFTVSWSYGLDVPPEGIISAQLLACKWARELVEACAPPSNAESIAREGVTINLAPPKPGESLGITIVDGWLAQFHCGGAIFDPGARGGFVHTAT